MKKILGCICLLLVLCLVSCKQENKIFEISPKNIVIGVGESERVNIKSDIEYYYEIEDVEIVEINSDNFVVGLKVGSTKVTYYSKNKNYDPVSITITVEAASIVVVGEHNMKKGNIIQLEVEFYHCSGKVIWETSDDFVCVVDEYGIVSSVEKGTCIITCRLGDLVVEHEVTVE